MHLRSISLSGCLLLSLALPGCSIMQTVKDLPNELPTKTRTTDSADNITIPADFPLPKYPGSIATAASDMKVEKTRIRNVMMASSQNANKICSYYSAWFVKNGWTIKSPANDQGVCTFMSAEKAGETVNLTAMRPKDAKETTLTLNISSRASDK